MKMLAALALALFVGTAAQAQTLNRGNTGEPESLDPGQAGTLFEENIIADLMVGLTTLDAAARPIPGMAERWETSPDGKTWTFHLREARWSDGKPVTANDFVFAWRRLLSPQTASRYAYNLWLLKNGQAITKGAMPPASLGAAAKDARTLILTLNHPAPYLPELLTHLTAMPLPTHVVAAKGNDWARPGNYVGNGPYVLKEWLPNDHITLAKNPAFYDAAHVRIDTVNYFPTPDAEAAIRRLRAGELDMQTPVALTQLDWLRANMTNALHITPSLDISYIAINLGYPPLKDARVRRALNLAYDREVVSAKILKMGEPPAYGIVPPGTANYPNPQSMDFRAKPYPARLAEAQALMRAAGYGPQKRLALAYTTTTNPDRRRLAAVLQAMLKAIYVDMSITTTDVPIHFKNLRMHNYQLANADWQADFNDASNFLDILRSDSGNNYAGYANPKFDTALNAAQDEPDAAKRAGLLAQAERMALADYPWITMRFTAQSDLVAPRVQGWVDNVRDFHRSRWLWLAK